ncbi:hypothetical protein PDESU_01598 [Pontiella desulfatans]|uniref:Uncharacterized protein n=1 Tax=Pontiella desulfatans TaxID=2750659 RepID=A0A6C2U000_PONDE|nr:hypothetical protein [Pontiella desulfatans]VGO13044.1 hypothetical protein PDESU_01598 [Pontiella desulfatans]
MKERVALLSAGMMLAAVTTMATTINFTEVEGYSAGQLTANSDWGGHTAFTVDPTGSGTVALDGSQNFKKAFYKTGLASNESYRVGMKFSFNRSTNSVTFNNPSVASAEFTEIAGTGGKRIALQLQRMKYNASTNPDSKKFRLGGVINSGAANYFPNSGTFDESVLGFDDASDNVSDDLWMEMLLVRGATETNWNATYILSNLTDTVQLMSYETGEFDTSSAFFTDDLYAVLGNVNFESDSQTSNRVVEQFMFDIGAVPPPPPVSIDTHFTLAEGYVAGNLGANADWGGHGADFQVNPTNTGIVLLSSSEQFKKAINQIPLTSNEVYSVGIEFAFTRMATNTISQQDVISVEFKETTTTANDSGRTSMQLQRFNNDSYRLAMVDQSGGGSSFPKSGIFQEGDLGFDTNETVSVSDDLWLGFTMTRGSSELLWTGVGVISNLTEGTEVVTHPVSFTTSSDLFNDGSLYAMFGCLNYESVSFTSNRVVDRFVATAGTSPAVAEQPMLVEFSAEQGYVPGDVVGQLGYWGGHAGENLVDGTTNYLVLSSSASDNFRQATYTYPLSTTNSQLEVGGTFRFNCATNATPNQNSMMIFALKDGISTGDDNMRVVLNRATTNAPIFQLGFNENSGGFSFTNSANLTGADLGFGPGDDLSDELKMSLIVYPGTETNNWSALVVLSNLTTGVEVDRLSVPAGEIIVSESWNSAPALYGNINSGWLESQTLTSNRQVESFYLAIRNFESAYAEWAAANGVGGMDEDFDEDGLNNLGEYGLGGDPKDPDDTGIKFTAINGGDFEFIHAMLADPESGIEYIVEVNDMGNLVLGGWTNTGITVTSGALDSEFDMVTNSIPMSGSQEFIRLRINEL